MLEGLIKRSSRRMLRPDVEPLAEDIPPEVQPLAAVPEAPRPRDCLIVDDSRMIRKVARTILERLGYTVAEAENGEEALARCREAMPDLILLDWNMPVMSGVEFVSSLRGLSAPTRSKVVFCTSNSDASFIRQGIEAGADEYVIKPFDYDSLRTKLERIGAA